MPDNYILDGDNYSQEDVLAAAEAKGLTIEEYINEWDNIRTDLEKITEFNQL